MQATQ